MNVSWSGMRTHLHQRVYNDKRIACWYVCWLNPKHSIHQTVLSINCYINVITSYIEERIFNHTVNHTLHNINSPIEPHPLNMLPFCCYWATFQTTNFQWQIQFLDLRTNYSSFAGVVGAGDGEVAGVEGDVWWLAEL